MLPSTSFAQSSNPQLTTGVFNGLLDLRRHNSPEFFFRFDQQKMIGRLQFKAHWRRRARKTP